MVLCGVLVGIFIFARISYFGKINLIFGSLFGCRKLGLFLWIFEV